MMEPLVVKLGGSLSDVADQVIDILTESGRDILVVPGGGGPADNVRKLHLNDEISHWLAILSMEYNGWIIASGGVESTDRIEIPVEGIKLLLPYRELRSSDPLPHTWDVTSDTIAAWVALRTSSNLLILKSIDGIYSEDQFLEKIDRPILTDSVDPSLIPFVLEHNIDTFVLNGRKAECLTGFLKGNHVKGSLISARNWHNH